MENFRGIVLMVVAMAAFALEDMFIKQVATTLPPAEILLLLSLGGTIVFSGLVLIRGERLFDPALLCLPVIGRSLGEAIGSIGVVLALAWIPLNLAAAIFQVMPLVVTLGAALFLGEAVGWRRWSAICAGFAGVLLIIRPGLSGFDPLALFALLGAIGLGARDVATRAVPHRISSFVLATWGFVVLTPTALLMMPFGTPFVLLDSASGMQMALVILAGMAGYYAIIAAMRVGEVAVVTPFRYSRLLFALVIGMIVFGEEPDMLTLIGAAIVIASGLYTLMRETRTRQNPGAA